MMMAPGSDVSASVNVQQYDSSIVVNKALAEQQLKASMDSLIKAHPLLKSEQYTQTEHLVIPKDSTFDFYLVFGLILAFGIIRYIHPRYFQNLLRAFRNPSFGNQQLKDQMETAMVPNVLMNLFFATSIGIYLYYVMKFCFPQRYGMYSPSVLVTVIVLCVLGLYLIKYLALQFSGWAFNMSTMVSHYIYNVFIINKIISIILLPFIVLLAFTQPLITTPAMIVSLFLVGVLFVNRYTRSWQVLGGLFQYSRFHFFTYLCASEILPIAVLAKLLIGELYY